MTFWHWLFCITTLYVVYTYLGYPALLTAWKAVRRPRPQAADPSYRPLVSVILTVRNEREAIAHKLNDLLAQDYPADRLEIWVASDQSTDGTNDVVAAYAEHFPQVRLVAFDENVGKSVAINRTAPLTNGEILLLSDARQRVDEDAVSLMVRHFADRKVGIVGAEMTLVNAAGESSADNTGLYWRYERSLRRTESALGLLTGVSGAFFAIRKSVFRDIPAGSYCEDVALALYARDAGYQVRWEAGAHVYETMRSEGVEFKRKVRTLVGNYQLLMQFWPLYLPWRGRLAFTLISHKLCRLFIPLALLALFVACLALVEEPFFRVAALAQVFFYAAGVSGLFRAALRRSRLVNACGAFCMLNWAALVALVHVLRHGPRIQWR